MTNSVHPPPGYKLIIAGTRKPASPEKIGHMIGEMIRIWGTPGEVISGAARGVDAIGEDWARANGIRVLRYPADWDAYGKMAGPRRNAQMADIADALLAFPGPNSRGTLDMISRMGSKKHVAVFRVEES